jgi:hypothetical protein
VEPIANPFFANLFFNLLDTAKLVPCGSLRFLQRHARTTAVFDQHFEVRMNLLVEVYLHMPR